MYLLVINPKIMNKTDSFNTVSKNIINLNNECNIQLSDQTVKGLAYYQTKTNIAKIVKLQLFFRGKLNLLHNIRDEMKHLLLVIQSISTNINTLNNYNMISNITYVTYMTKIDRIFDIIGCKLSRPINLVNYGGMNSYKFFIEISKIKFDLISIATKCGISKIKNALYLVTGKMTDITDNTLMFYNDCFNPTTIDIYSSKSAIEKFEFNSNNDRPITEILCTDLDVVYTLFEYIYGAKLYVPINGRLLIITGFFKKDYKKYALSTYPFVYNKYVQINQMLRTYPSIPEMFKINYIECMQLKELLLCTDIYILETVQTNYKLLQTYCHKNITSIIKDFLNASIVDKVNLLTLFLLNDDTGNDNTSFIAYILYDVYIYNQHGITGPTNSVSDSTEDIQDDSISFKVSQNKNKLHVNNTIFDYLHWKIQIKLKLIFKEMGTIQKSITNFTDAKIPYEKRIQLMRVNNLVKTKAMTKLKEINSSKGESNAKAQQYLDGLLKIPFGMYKREPIMRSLDLLIDRCKNSLLSINKYIDEVRKYVNEDLFYKVETDIKKIVRKTKLTSKEITDFVLKYISVFETKSDFEQSHINIDTIYINDNISNHVSCIENNIEKIFEKEEQNKLDNHTVNKNNSSKQFRNKFEKKMFSKTQLNKMKKKKLYDIANSYSETDDKSSLLKKDLIRYILKKQINYTKTKNKSTVDDIPIHNKHTLEVVNSLKNIYKDINNYKLKCAKYLEYVNKSLDESVYGMEEPKLQIKHIIAQWINGTNDGYIFGFEGSPGTGKTTLAKCGIAKCIQDDEGNSRPFSFIALGGSSNGSTLEGHNYTYVGSTWGKIVDTLMTTKCMNPIIYIDELDKISKTEHGKEIIGILTHMTDMSQNELFNDKYFAGVPIDISKCLIIFSYNDVSKIDKILLDRIHRIKIKDMNKYEKVEVMKNYVYKQIISSIGFKCEDIILDDNELIHIIDTYTCEPGVRKLKEKVFELFREVNYRYLLGEINEFPFKITIEFIENKFSNKPKIHYNTIAKQPQFGIVNGLFATESGLGGVLFVECYKTISDVRLKLNLTGQQGKTMRESMEVAKTVAWNLLTPEQQYKINTEQPFGLHIHCPEAATPKDGPSAGAAIVLTIYSQLLGKKIDNTFALTGEIRFMNGMINKIGGLDLKIGGARRAGVKTVLCPRENEDDLKKILSHQHYPKDKNFKVIMVDTIEDVIDLMIID